MSVRLQHKDYTVGWICALPLELAAAQGMLDEEHDPLPQDAADTNQYTLGRIGTHNVALACLPAGELGVVATAVLVTRMLSTFRHLQLGLLVGVGGGIPSEKHDIRLGDVVVGHRGVIQYDMGKTMQGGRFACTQVQRPPSQLALLTVSKLQARYRLGKQMTVEYIDAMTGKYKEFCHPGIESDILYRSDYDHPVGVDSCVRCKPSQIVRRVPRSSTQPVIHYGLIGSGSQVMRHGGTREMLRAEHDILCFEMEAAGLMSVFPSLVIRGVCDYSDSHKNKQWQEYASVTAAAYAKELLSIMQGPVETKRSAEAPCFMVPFLQTPTFVGREDMLKKIAEELLAKHPVILAGIGGVGKTQLAVRYCFQFREKSPTEHVFWVNASTAVNFEESYREIAKLLCIPGHEEPDFEVHSEVCKRLSADNAGQWIMVLDNLDDGQALAAQMKFIPRSSQTAGSIIVTTRDRRVSQNLLEWDHMTGHPLSVPPLDEHEARSLLETALGPEQRRSVNDLLKVLELLGYFPLALTQAVAFIKQNCTTVSKYKHLLEHSNQTVADQLLRDAEYRDIHRYEGTRGSVYRTWEISFCQIREENIIAADLLAWMSMFDTSVGVPERLIWGNERFDDWEITKALGILKSFSLITDGPKESLIMHLMIQKAVQSFLSLAERERYHQEALIFLTNMFPNPKSEYWEVYEELTPHAEKVLRYEFEETKENLAEEVEALLHRATLLHNVAAYRNQRGRYQSAHNQAVEAYTIRQQLLGEGNLESLDSLELVALVLINQGKYKAAQEKQETVLRARKGLKGNNDDKLCILESERRLADVSLKLGRLDDAARMYEKVLKVSVELVGDMDRKTLELMDDYGEVLEHQGRFTEAEKIYRKAFSAKRSTLGKEHESTVKTKILLNVLLALRNGHYEGNYAKAYELYCEALGMSTKILGEKHPDTIRLNCNIASLHAIQQKWTEAEEVQLQACRLFTEILGNNHPSTLVCQSNLAVLKQEQEQYADAEELHRSLWDRRRTVLGAHHPHTLTSMYHLAEVLTELKEHEESRDIFRKVLDGRVDALGSKHPDTLRCMSSLAGVLYELRQFDDAEDLYRQCLQLKIEVLGSEHPDNLTDMNDLAEVLLQQNKLSEAESLLRQVLQMQKEETWNKSVSKGNLGRALYLQGKYDDAIELYQETLQTVEDRDPFAKVLSDRLETALQSKRESQAFQKVLQKWMYWLLGR